MYRILLVDDEILVRDAIKENMNWAAMDCELVKDCENGRQAWDYVQKNPVDIVLTDILMPFVDGLELARLIHENYPDIVVVIFSGFGEFEYAKKAMQYNVSEYLLKPVTSVELRQVIERMKGLVDDTRRKKLEKERMDRTQENYYRNEAVIRSKAMEALVNRTRETEESLEELKKLDIRLQPGSSCVAVFDMDVYSDYYETDAGQQQESALMAFVLFNIGSEIVSKENAGIVYQEGDCRVCVLFMLPRSKESDLKVRELCRSIQRTVYDAIGIETSVGIGGWVRTPEELHVSRQQALELLKRRYLLGGGLTLSYEQCVLNGTVRMDAELEQLGNAIRSGEMDEVRPVLEEIQEKIQDSLAEKSRVLVSIQQVIQKIADIRLSMDEDREKTERRKEEIQCEAVDQKNLESLMKVISAYAADTAAYVGRMNSTQAQRQARMAADYIRENYVNPNLSLNDLCSYLNVSVSYFSSFYKEQTGETFTETLGRIRMEKARELLEHTTLRNYEIAEKVGFADPHYFGIAFKKATGMTPMEYAKEKRR